jgi:hypothetical protein
LIPGALQPSQNAGDFLFLTAPLAAQPAAEQSATPDEIPSLDADVPSLEKPESSEILAERPDAPTLSSPQIEASTLISPLPIPIQNIPIPAIEYGAESAVSGKDLNLRQLPEPGNPTSSEISTITPPPTNDRGELVWSADFVVNNREKPQVETRVAPQPAIAPEFSSASDSVESAPLAVESEIERASQGESNTDRPRKPPAERFEAPSPDFAQDGAAGHSPDTRRDNSEDYPSDPQRGTPRPARTARKEQPEMHKQSAELDIPAPTFGTATTHHSDPSPAPVGEKPNPTPTASVGGAELHVAKPLRPTQIATLSVDVPSPGNGDANAPIRLSVTQRGDQVNVRLRSWDAGTTPVESDRMQPLLQSLADQGLIAESAKSSLLPDDAGLILTESIRDKPLTTPESAAGNNDQQSFQSPDDRQQRNQERQQQALFMRRQMRLLQATSFDIRSVLDPNPQQGAR